MVMDNRDDSRLKYITEFFNDLLRNWYVFAITLAVVCGGTLVYVKYASKIYKVKASVLLKVERSNAYGGRSDDILKVYELIEQDKNLQNEIYYFKSTPLVKSVVEKMDLLVSYYLQEDKIPKEVSFSLKALYKDSPFMIVLNKDHLQPAETFFYIKILDEEQFMISADNPKTTIIDYRDESVAVREVPYWLNGTYSFGEEIEDPFTSFRVLLNSNYQSDTYQGKDLFFKLNTTEALTRAFKGSLGVEISALEATMVEMTFNSDNLQKGLDFLEGLIDRYNESSLEEKNYLANKTIEHLDFQLSDISQSLGSSEQELQNIRRSTSVMNVDEKAANIYNQLQTLENQRDEAQRTRGYLIEMDDYFASNRDSSGLAPSAMGLNDPLLNDLIQNLTELNAERQTIINNNQLLNPRLRTIEISINNLKKVITENLKYSINATTSELNEVNGKIRSLNREFSSLPRTQTRLLGIERKFNLNEDIYMKLLEQKIQAQIIKASNLPDLDIVEPPQYVGIHSPKTIILLFVAVILGTVIPGIFIVGKKLFSNRIHDKEELKAFSNLPQIGSIPQDGRSSINVIVDQPNSITAEAFHSVRSNLIYYLMGKSNQVILVTSTMEGEGKSFSALNIASSLAVTNNKTVLVEFDLRRPSDLYNKLGIRGLVGVSSLLINKASLDEITINSDVENLDIILAGQVPPNPIELISSRQTARLFEELKKKYDYIIIDTPPYGVLTDSFVLMKYADITLYVTRLGQVKKRMLLSSFDDIASKKIENIHVLINGEVPKQGSYGKYYTTTRREIKLLKRVPLGGDKHKRNKTPV